MAKEVDTPDVVELKKRAALAALERRKEEAVRVGQVDNASLRAGADMYYYCQACGLLAQRVGELYMGHIKSHCDECQKLKDKGWLPETSAA